MKEYVDEKMKEFEEKFTGSYFGYSAGAAISIQSFLRESIIQTHNKALTEAMEAAKGLKKPLSRVTSIMMKKGIKGEPLANEINPMRIHNNAIDSVLSTLSSRIIK